MNETPPSLSLNDETDYGLCFACGPRNPSGMQLRFERDGDRVITAFQRYLQKVCKQSGGVPSV